MNIKKPTVFKHGQRYRFSFENKWYYEADETAAFKTLEKLWNDRLKTAGIIAKNVKSTEKILVKDAITKFIAEKSLSIRETSIRNYGIALNKFSGGANKWIYEYTREEITNFLLTYDQESTRHHYKINILALFRWCDENGYLIDKSILKLKLPKLNKFTKRGKRPATQEDYEKVKAGLQSRLAGVHWQASVAILLVMTTGMRPNEAVQIIPANYDQEKSLVKLDAEGTKNGKPRTYTVPAFLAFWLNKLKTDYSESPRLLVSARGKPFSIVGLQTAFKRLKIELGLDKGLGFYSFRKLFGKELLNSGLNLAQVGSTMGHDASDDQVFKAYYGSDMVDDRQLAAQRQIQERLEKPAAFEFSMTHGGKTVVFHSWVELEKAYAAAGGFPKPRRRDGTLFVIEDMDAAEGAG